MFLLVFYPFRLFFRYIYAVRRMLLGNKPVIGFRNIQTIRPIGSGAVSLPPSCPPPLVYMALIPVALHSMARAPVLKTHRCGHAEFLLCQKWGRSGLETSSGFLLSRACSDQKVLYTVPGPCVGYSERQLWTVL